MFVDSAQSMIGADILGRVVEESVQVYVRVLEVGQEICGQGE